MQDIISEAEYARMVAVDNGLPITTSLKVAEYFGKRHADVLRSIQNLECSRKFNERNFAPIEYRDSRGRSKPAFGMTKDGFMFLVMGYNGKKAARIKEAYINAFNWMAERLHSYDHRRNELTALYKAGQYSASLCGRGLNRWKQDKRELEEQMEIVEQEGQLSIPFIDAPTAIREVA